jgi:hypothetical protein
MSDKRISLSDLIERRPRQAGDAPGQADKPEFTLRGATAVFAFPGEKTGDPVQQVFVRVENNELQLFPKRSASHRMLLRRLGVEQ